MRSSRRGLIYRWNKGAGDIYDGDYNDGLQNKDGEDRIAPGSPMARRGRSPIGRSEDSSGASTAPSKTSSAYSGGWKTC